MKKSLFILAAAALALCFTACKKDDDNGRRLTHFTAGMERVASQQNAKVYLENNLIKWEAGDKIMVTNGNNHAPYDNYIATPDATDPTWATFTAENDGISQGPYFATYPTSYFYGDGTMAINYFFEQEDVDLGIDKNFPMYSESADGETFQFKNLCGVLKIHLQQEGVTVEKIVITADQYISGYFAIHATDGIPSLSMNESDIEYAGYTITANCSTPQDISSGHDFYIYLPPSPAAGYNLTMNIIQPDGSGFSKSCNGVVVERSKYTNVTTTVLIPVEYEVPTGTLGGLFSISYSAKIAFAPGNLVATTTGGAPSATTTTWSFHTHQYDMVGEDNSINGTCDLLCYSTTNNYYGLTESTDEDDYSGSFVDWGTAMGQGWYTPTYNDWDFIIHYRPHHNELFASGCIEVTTGNFVNGYIILPDDWELPDGCSFLSYLYNFSFEDNTYTPAEWATMEANGAVFLPIIGYRQYGTYYTSNTGYYWLYTGPSQYNYLHLSDNGSSAPNLRSCSPDYSIAVRLAKAAIVVSGDVPTKAIRPKQAAKQGDKSAVSKKPMPQRNVQKAGRPSHGTHSRR